MLNKACFPWIFLGAGILAIAFLSWHKYHLYEEVDISINSSSKLPSYAPLPHHESVELSLEDHLSYLSKEPISYEQYEAFVDETGYITWREENMRYPTWRYPTVDTMTPSTMELSEASKPSNKSPVRWLTREDAIAYCKWVSKKQRTLSAYEYPDQKAPWQHSGCRLPTEKELMALENSPKDWEWTTHTLKDFSSKLSRAPFYDTAWNASFPLRHRRPEDLTEEEFSQTTFRVAWTMEVY